MYLADHPYAAKWLGQFDEYHANIAKTYLRSLQLISFSEFEGSISKLITELAQNHGSRIAVYSIIKPTAPVEGKRTQGTSSDRVNHMLTNLERLDHHIINSPTIESLRAEKIKHIIFVDDIIGTGTRFIKFWKENISRSIISWKSYKKVNLWIICYAAHTSGIINITKEISSIHNANILFNFRLPDNSKAYDDEIISLFKYYGNRTNRSRAALGYGDLMTHVIFQHGCPNNAPSFLWSNGKRWRALFPNRGISQEIYDCFKNPDLVGSAEILWESNQHKLAIRLIELLDSSTNKDKTHLIAVLGLISRGCSFDKLRATLSLSNHEVTRILSICNEFKLVDENQKITAFGRDVIERLRNKGSTNKLVKSIEEELILYYPTQYWGLQRQSSEFSDSSNASRNQ